MWFIGEYADELMESFFDSNRQQQFDALSSSEVIELLGDVLSASTTDGATRGGHLPSVLSIAMTLTALLKCADRLDGCEGRVEELIKPYETACGLQIQQRSCEYDELLKDEFAGLREGVLERMPPLNIDYAKARRAEAEEGEEEEGEEAESADWMDENPSASGAPGRSASKAEPVGDLMDDLLGLNFNAATSTPAAKSSQSAEKNDDPFSGVMDMLKTMDASTTQSATDTSMDIASLFPTAAPAAPAAPAASDSATDVFGTMSEWLLSV